MCQALSVTKYYGQELKRQITAELDAALIS